MIRIEFLLHAIGQVQHGFGGLSLRCNGFNHDFKYYVGLILCCDEKIP